MFINEGFFFQYPLFLLLYDHVNAHDTADFLVITLVYLTFIYLLSLEWRL